MTGITGRLDQATRAETLDIRRLVRERTEPSSWASLTVGAGWAGVWYARKVGDVVHMRGNLSGSGSPSTAFATLPVGFRPPGSSITVLLSACDGTLPRMCGIEVCGEGHATPGALRVQPYYGGGTVTNVYAGFLVFSVV